MNTRLTHLQTPGEFDEAGPLPDGGSLTTFIDGCCGARPGDLTCCNGLACSTPSNNIALGGVQNGGCVLAVDAGLIADDNGFRSLTIEGPPVGDVSSVSCIYSFFSDDQCTVTTATPIEDLGTGACITPTINGEGAINYVRVECTSLG